jgi:hypothetical protein
VLETDIRDRAFGSPSQTVSIMAWQWRKSKGLFGGLLRLNFGRRGLGVSVGGSD